MAYFAARQVGCALLSIASWRMIPQAFTLPDTPEIVHVAPPPSDRFPTIWYPSVGDGTSVLPAPVTDRPYIAEVGDVDAVTGESHGTPTGLQARDQLGRTRTETVDGSEMIGDRQFKTKMVRVSDPVTHCIFSWIQHTTDVAMRPEQRVAAVTCFPQTLRYKELNLFEILMKNTPAGVTVHGDTVTKVEYPALVKVDGITITRLRITNSFTDEQGQVKTWTTETWYSPELKEVIRRTNETGFNGLIHIQRGDPDPSLFYPPDGYRIEPRPLR